MSQLPSEPSHQRINTKTSTLRRVRRLSYLLDNAIPIPGTPYRVGLDPLLGLLPGGGDFLGTALSAYIVVGIVPVVGDLVDVTWKANVKNIRLLEEQLDLPPQPRQKADWLFLALMLGVLLLVVMVVAAISVMLLRWLLGAISS
jgi:hypothetical protein